MRGGLNIPIDVIESWAQLASSTPTEIGGKYIVVSTIVLLAITYVVVFMRLQESWH
jgi:hypothetical protein